MDVTGNQPDKITEAAIAAVSEAVELAGQQEPQPSPVDRHRIRDRVRRLLPKRVQRTRRTLRIPRTRRARAEAGIGSGLRRLSASIRTATRRGAHVTGRGAYAGGRWLSAQVVAMAPRLPVRDLATLRTQFPGRSPDELSNALIEGASRASAAVGVAVGAWAVLPFIPAAGLEITAETLAVVGIEIKLVAELHEVYGMAAPGSVVERMTSYVGAWAQRRGVALAPGGLVLAAGSPLARQLQRRLTARAGRSLFSLGPLLTGAAAGGLINRNQTRKLGRAVSDDLRRHSPHVNGWQD
jgi:hypothetical protein